MQVCKMSTTDKTDCIKSSNTLVSSKREQNDVLYCLCGQSYDSPFMITCDKCNVKYHGDCLQLTRTQTKNIEKYICPPCISKDSKLHIVYRNLEEKFSDSEERKSVRKTTNGDSCKVERMKESTPSDKYNPLDRCEDCINCFRSNNCGKCSNCLSMKEQCLKRICVQSDWWLRIRKRSHSSNASSSSPGKQTSSAKFLNTNEGSHAIKLTKVEMGAAAKNRTPSPPPSFVGNQGSQAKQDRAAKKRSPRKQDMAEYSSRDRKISKLQFGTERTMTLEERRREAASSYNHYYSSQKYKKTMKKDIDDSLQCVGPECTHSVQRNSKYCSDECGIKLAKKRLLTYLPLRVHDYWSTRPTAANQAAMVLKRLDEQIQQLTSTINLYGTFQKDFRDLVKILTQYEPVEKDENVSAPDADYTIHCSVCSTEFPSKQCAKHTERCFTRLERQACFGTVGKSRVNPYNIFCEQHNKANNTYCKRLRVMCSEHYKPEIEADVKICGYPLVWTRCLSFMIAKLLSLINSEIVYDKGFCLRPRRSCSQHHNWIQNVLGLIDVELMNRLIKLDSCYERKRQIQVTESTRGDVLTLLCNYTRKVCDSNPLNNTFSEKLNSDAGENRSTIAISEHGEQASVESVKDELLAAAHEVDD